MNWNRLLILSDQKLFKMGVPFTKQQRYMKGKVPLKYWQEDMWPEMEDLLLKLNIDQQKGQDLFLAFCAMDTDAGGTVDIEECFAYLGGTRTRFTERIWHKEGKINEEGEYEEGLNFKEFAIVCWNYCTMSVSQLARSIFEIFDLEPADELERADIEAMYRMMYDCEEHDEYYVRKLPFNKKSDTIGRIEFCDYVSKDRHIIQPAVDYQKRLRSKMGGFLMWENLAGFRRRMFMVYDTQSKTTVEAVLNIINSEDPNRKARKMAADRILEEKRLMAEAKAAAEAEEQRAIERAKEEEARKREMAAEDRFMKLYWLALDQKRAEFEDDEFLVDDAWRRKEARLELYALLDSYQKASDEYWSKMDVKDLDLMIGTDADHDARFKDLLKTPDGKVTVEYTTLRLFFARKDQEFEQMKKQHAANSKLKGHLVVQDSQIEIGKKIERVLTNRALIAAGALKSKAKAAQLRVVEFSEESKLMKQLGSKAEIKQAHDDACEEIREELKKVTISKAETHIQERRKEREMDLKRVNFELATCYGSRITQWEYLWDRPNEKYVYVNTDTMEVVHAKTAICEMCDAFFDQSDKHCKQCNAGRSTKNQLLYRPLGFKDIRID